MNRGHGLGILGGEGSIQFAESAGRAQCSDNPGVRAVALLVLLK